MYTVEKTTQFCRDAKKIIKRGQKTGKLQDIIQQLRQGEALPAKHRPHKLTGNWVNHWECHIEPDWLLIYRLDEDRRLVILERTGSHADLFK